MGWRTFGTGRLTNGYHNVRRDEFTNALSAYNDKGIILNYPDIPKGAGSDWQDVSTGMEKDLKLLFSLKPWKEIVTHNPDGEYGHIQHKTLSSFVLKVYNETLAKTHEEPILYYFGKYYPSWTVDSNLTSDMRLPEDVLKKKKAVVGVYKSQKLQWVQKMLEFELWKRCDVWIEDEKNKGKGKIGGN